MARLKLIEKNKFNTLSSINIFINMLLFLTQTLVINLKDKVMLVFQNH